MSLLNAFHFKVQEPDRVLLTNDWGRYIFLSPKEFHQLLQQHETENPDLNQQLRNNHFLLEPEDLLSDETAGQLRDMKSYLFTATALHIFVVTDACNYQCVYCQAQADRQQKKYYMDKETARKAVDVALQSPAGELTFEFQGGEPLLNFPVIREIILYTEQKNQDKKIHFTLVSNLSLLTAEIRDFLLDHQVSICTSLDGPAPLQCRNRVSRSEKDSYEYVDQGVRLLQQRGCPVGAIETTTRYSLPCAREIVQEYKNQGQHSLFLRPLTPLGYANSQWQRIGYTAEEFLDFYRRALREIMEVNRQSYFLREQQATYFLNKILRGEADNYMELRSPCGAALGQLAYNYDGNVYTCDEARMVAEMGKPIFRLGNVRENTYQEIIASRTCKATCSASILETIPGCCDCVYQPYCGVCPVINYALEGNLFAGQPNGYRCQIYKGILDTLFAILQNEDSADRKILESWVMKP